VAGRILDRVRDRPVVSTGGAALNRSQVAILRLVRRGYSNREIAAEVHLSENTVKTHLQDVFRKLGARNRVEAAMLAAERRWI
jgi:DNA-binding NarL/FixJ family response regulator